MADGYVELEVMDEDFEKTAHLFVMSRRENKIVASLSGVTANPVRYNGVWSIPFTYLDKSSTAYFTDEEVGWFIRYNDKEAYDDGVF